MSETLAKHGSKRARYDADGGSEGETAAFCPKIPQFNEDILTRVFFFLAKPTPLPQHMAAARPDSAKQPDLVSVLLTCRLFYNVASPLLYHHAITHSFPLFIRGIDNPRIPLIRSKLELVNRTERLSIEHLACRHEMRVAERKHDLARRGDADAQEVDRLRRNEDILCFTAIQEMTELKNAFRHVNYLPKASRAFGRLRSLAIGAYSGFEEYVELPTSLTQGQGKQVLDDLTWQLLRFIRNTPTLVNYCDNDMRPLFLPSKPVCHDSPTGPPRTITFSTHTTAPRAENSFPVRFGLAPTNWYIHHRTVSSEIVPLDSLLLSAADTIGNAMRARGSGAEGLRPPPDDNIVICANCYLQLSQGDLDRMNEGEGQEAGSAQDRIPDARDRLQVVMDEKMGHKRAKDQVTFSSMEVAPACAACGWCVSSS